MDDDLLVERHGAVAVLRLNRPARMNALTASLRLALLDAVRDVAADDSVRAVVLTGTGRGFCVGQDLGEHGDLLAGGDPAPLSSVTEHYNPLITALAGLPKPVIAAVNGAAAGAGASIALACDLRIAAESSTFVLAFAGIGLSLDSGVSWTLPRLIGAARATALALLAEPVDAAAALAMGMVNAVVTDDVLDRSALELATRLAAGPTAAYAAIKESLAFAATHTLAESLAEEARLQARAGATFDHRAAVEAFRAKQRPTFTGR